MLIEIGWAVSKTEQEEIIALAKSGYSFDLQNRFEIPEKKVPKIELEDPDHLDNCIFFL